MTEYIEREAAISASDILNFDEPYGTSISAIRRIPAADVAPVVHGKWQFVDNDGYWYDECSVCGGRTENHDGSPPGFNYCPNCGARMNDA